MTPSPSFAHASNSENDKGCNTSLSHHKQVCFMRLRFKKYLPHHMAQCWEIYLDKLTNC